MEQPASLLTDDIRSYIGRESPPYTMEVDKTAVRLFARAVGYTDPVFYDEEYARSKGLRSLVAPPGFFGHAPWKPGDPGIPLRLPSLPVKRRLAGGNEFEYYGVVCAGDVLTCVTRIKDISERHGRAGPMVLLTLETDYSNQFGELVARSRLTLIRY